MKETYDPIGDMLLNSLRNGSAVRSIPALFKLFVVVFLRLPQIVVESLYTTGYGIRCYGVVPFLICSLSMLLLAEASQNLAGDGLFLLWALFTTKYIAEYVWAMRRRRQGEEHTMTPGASLFSLLGVEGDALPLFAFIIFGLLVTLFELGWYVGPILILGGVGGLLLNAFYDHKVAVEEAQAEDRTIELKMEGHRRAPTSTESSTFQPVEID